MNSKYLLLLVLIAAVLNSCSDSASTGHPTTDDGITVGATGNIGHDLFVSDYVPGYGVLNNNGIRSLNYDGSGWSFLYRNIGMHSSPRGTKMALVVDSSIYLGDITGGAVKKIYTPHTPVFYAILAPDAKKILYTTTGDFLDSINIYDLETHRITSLMTPKFGLLTYNLPVFSDDSKQVLLNISNPGVSIDTTELWLVSVEGSTRKLITDNQLYDFYSPYGLFSTVFELSPDGTKCAYVGGKKQTLFIQDINSGMIEAIADSAGGWQWSATGNYALFYRYYKNGEDSNAVYDIHTKQIRYFPADGGFSGGGVGYFMWSADEQSAYCLVNFLPTAGKTSFLGKMNIATGQVDRIKDLSSVWSVYRAKAIGEH